MKEKIEVDDFKELILDMYRGYPNWRYTEDMIKKVIKTETDIKHLIEQGILIEEEIDGKKYFGLGSNALSLVSSWKNEKMANGVRKLTVVLVILTIILTLLTAIFYFK